MSFRKCRRCCKAKSLFGIEDPTQDSPQFRTIEEYRTSSNTTSIAGGNTDTGIPDPLEVNSSIISGLLQTNTISVSGQLTINNTIIDDNGLILNGPIIATDTDNDVAVDRLIFTSTIGPTTRTAILTAPNNTITIPMGNAGVLYYDGSVIKGVTDSASMGEVLTWNGSEPIWVSGVGSTITLSDSGSGLGLTNDGMGPALTIKSLIGGSNISIVDNGPDITISVAFSGIQSFITFTDEASLPNSFMINAGTGISITDLGNDIFITNTDTGSSVSLSSAGGTSLVNDGFGPALANKGLVAGTGISFTTTANDITINNSSPANSVVLSSAGGVNSLIDTGIGSSLIIKGLIAGVGSSIVDNGTFLTISSIASGSPPFIITNDGMALDGTTQYETTAILDLHGESNITYDLTFTDQMGITFPRSVGPATALPSNPYGGGIIVSTDCTITAIGGVIVSSDMSTSGLGTIISSTNCSLDAEQSAIIASNLCSITGLENCVISASEMCNITGSVSVILGSELCDSAGGSIILGSLNCDTTDQRVFIAGSDSSTIIPATIVSIISLLGTEACNVDRIGGGLVDNSGIYSSLMCELADPVFYSSILASESSNLYSDYSMIIGSLSSTIGVNTGSISTYNTIIASDSSDIVDSSNNCSVIATNSASCNGSYSSIIAGSGSYTTGVNYCSMIASDSLMSGTNYSFNTSLAASVSANGDNQQFNCYIASNTSTITGFVSYSTIIASNSSDISVPVATEIRGLSIISSGGTTITHTGAGMGGYNSIISSGFSTIDTSLNSIIISGTGSALMNGEIDNSLFTASISSRVTVSGKTRGLYIATDSTTVDQFAFFGLIDNQANSIRINSSSTIDSDRCITGGSSLSINNGIGIETYNGIFVSNGVGSINATGPSLHNLIMSSTTVSINSVGGITTACSILASTNSDIADTGSCTRCTIIGSTTNSSINSSINTAQLGGGGNNITSATNSIIIGSGSCELDDTTRCAIIASVLGNIGINPTNTTFNSSLVGTNGCDIGTTADTNVSYNSIICSFGCDMAGDTANNTIMACSGCDIDASCNQNFIAASFNNISIDNTGGLANNINLSIIGCVANVFFDTSTTIASYSCMMACGGLYSTITSQEALGTTSTFIAAVNDTVIEDTSNFAVLACDGINCTNSGIVTRDAIIACTNGGTQDWAGIDNSVMLASDLGGGTAVPRVSNTVVGADASGIRWELDSVAGTITAEGAITPFAVLPGLAKMIANQSTIQIPYGRLVRLVKGTKVRLCKAGEKPHFITRPPNACSILTGDAPFSWHKLYMQNVWGSRIKEKYIDTEFEDMKLEKKKEIIEYHKLGNHKNVKNLLDWLDRNENITKYKEKFKINPQYNPNKSYQRRTQRLDEWSACEWSGIAPLLVDNSVIEESYVISADEGIGTYSDQITRIYCVEIMDTSNLPEYIIINEELDTYLQDGYNIAICTVSG